MHAKLHLFLLVTLAASLKSTSAAEDPFKEFMREKPSQNGGVSRDESSSSKRNGNLEEETVHLDEDEPLLTDSESETNNLEKESSRIENENNESKTGNTTSESDRNDGVTESNESKSESVPKLKQIESNFEKIDLSHYPEDEIDFEETVDDEDGERMIYVNEFAVELEGDLREVELIASIYGFRFKHLRYLHGVYLFTHPTTPARSKRSADDVISRLKGDPHVRFVEQQKHLHREKRGSYRERYARLIEDAYNQVHAAVEARLEKRGVQPDKIFNDPQYAQQWYLTSGSHVTRSTSSGLDLNTSPVWAGGFSGRGVVVTVLDDGIQHNHTDLQTNYDPRASGDLNDDDDDPMPNYNVDGNDHGTMCSGEIAAVADNNNCGIGVAYNANIGGVRMLDGVITDVLEAGGLGFGLGHVDIYSASWGPSDDGKHMQAPGHYALAALIRGIQEGRGGKGSVYVWAGGNGGIHDDSGNADGYVSSIYTIAVGSVDADGESNYFNEPASSLMTMVVTGGRKGHGLPGPPGNVVTTGWHNRCVSTFGGTSAAAPLMAGCLALVLEANPSLTWRDVQHLVVRGSRLVQPDETRWTINGAGHHVSHDFGFGLADCGLMVELAQNWTLVPGQHVCEIQESRRIATIPAHGTASLNLTTDGCAQTNDVITRIEHVEVKVIIIHPVRGDLKLTLTSPSGTRSVILKTRNKDTSVNGIDFKFMSVHFWDENPDGVWTLEVSDKPRVGSGHQGRVTHFSLIIYGTDDSQTSDVDNGNLNHSRRGSTTKDLQEIHEEEMHRSRRVLIRKKKASVKKRKSQKGDDDKSFWSLKNSDENISKKGEDSKDKNSLLTNEERELVKRVLNELDQIDASNDP